MDNLMQTRKRKYAIEEFARRGEQIYEQLAPTFDPSVVGKFVVIDIDSGDYEIDTDEIAASDRLIARRPEAQSWLVKIGSRTARRFAASRGIEFQ
jgi:hypothetical protein